MERWLLLSSFSIRGPNATVPEETRAWVRGKDCSNHLVMSPCGHGPFSRNFQNRLQTIYSAEICFLGSEKVTLKTASGKIQKFKLKEDGLKLVREGYGLQ